MILEPTVFVLGAGASVPYGFQAGEELVRNIIGDLQNDSTGELARMIRLAVPAAAGATSAFRAALIAARPYSIDDFLQSNASFAGIGKVAIAYELIKRERAHELETPNGTHEQAHRERQWVRYLAAQLRTWLSPSGEQRRFTDNRLSIVTFNFDRSFEFALFNELRHYLGGREKALEAMRTAVEIVHVHGSLGGCRWMDEGGFCRDYSDHTDEQLLAQCAARLRIISDELEGDPALSRARELLRAALHVRILGFSYHPTNLNRLDFLAVCSDGNKRSIEGTQLRLPPGRALAMRERYPRFTLRDSRWDILTFLENDYLIHA